MNSIQVTFRDLPYSQSLEDSIQDHADKLSQHFERFLHCRVVLTISQNHKHQGKLYNVRINLAVPGKELVVTKQQDEDIHVAIRDAFNALGRQLDDYFRKRRGDVKKHEALLYGFVVRIFPGEGFGFIKGHDGNEYYFSATNVASKTFHHLAVGDTVQFMTEAGNEGLQAHRVTIEKHNHAENF